MRVDGVDRNRDRGRCRLERLVRIEVYACGLNGACACQTSGDRPYAGIAVLIGQPYERCAAGEQADAAAQLGLFVVMDIPVEADARGNQNRSSGYLVGHDTVGG